MSTRTTSVDLTGQPITVDLDGAARIMKVHPETVKKEIRAGRLAAGQNGRAYVMLTRDVVALTEARIVEQTAARMRLTKAAQTGRSRAGSRSAPAS